MGKGGRRESGKLDQATFRLLRDTPHAVRDSTRYAKAGRIKGQDKGCPFPSPSPSPALRCGGHIAPPRTPPPRAAPHRGGRPGGRPAPAEGAPTPTKLGKGLNQHLQLISAALQGSGSAGISSLAAAGGCRQERGAEGAG